LLGAAKAAPVVSSMAALPVWANGVSISGNLSGNVSGNYTEALFDGCSPGYYHPRGNDINHRNNPLSSAEYQKKFYEVFVYNNYYPMPDRTVQYVLTPKYWEQHEDLKLERFALTAYYNASGSSGAVNFPYTTQQILDFYELVLQDPSLKAEAIIIFDNLIHGGGTSESEWTSLDTRCS
jgi:hypothetical protein